jgi:hypothetical protein
VSQPGIVHHLCSSCHFSWLRRITGPALASLSTVASSSTGSCSLRLDGQAAGIAGAMEQDQQDGGQDHDRCHREDQHDQDVGGEPKSAAVVPGFFIRSG